MKQIESDESLEKFEEEFRDGEEAQRIEINNKDVLSKADVSQNDGSYIMIYTK